MKETPEKLREIIKLFNDHSLSYLLFKCEHILKGENKNLDLLFLHRHEYELAAKLLKKQGFVLYLPEKVEKYKRMYVKFNGTTLTAVHLHQEISWHGVIVLDKKLIFDRAKDKIPSPEDSLLIHSAHALFENFKVSKFHQELLKKYKIQSKDHRYLNFQLRKNGWKKSFNQFIQSDFSINKNQIFSAYLGCLLKTPTNGYNLILKVIRTLLRKISIKRKGYLIVLVGANGTGKSTIKKALIPSYQPLTDFVNGLESYYFGWKKSFLSQNISSILPQQLKEIKTFENASKERIKGFNLFQELLFSYIYLSFIFRYIKHIYPKLCQNKLIIADRYFHDLYGQYPYSKNSKILKWLPFPKPDQLFILNARTEIIMEREKEGFDHRKLQPTEKLECQRERYLDLTKKFKSILINTEEEIDTNIQTIIKETWRNYLTNK